MSILVSAKNISKSAGIKQLFSDLSFGIFEGEKIGLIGYNGSGKSTLLKIIAGQESVDEGEIVRKKDLIISYVPQIEVFEKQTVLEEVIHHLNKQNSVTKLDELTIQVQAQTALSVVGLDDFQRTIQTLSGGWRKRLGLALGLSLNPDLLILDEPTNHMDFESILWLESYLSSYSGALLLVSHDRTFLDNCVKRVIELDMLYEKGFISFEGGYTAFVEKRDEYIVSQQNQQSRLQSKVRREVEWLRSGVKARTTKSQSRIDSAHQLIDQLNDIKTRNLSVGKQSRIEIDASKRKSKRLIELQSLSVGFDSLCLIKNIQHEFNPERCIGILGRNGSGKSSLLKVITGQLNPQSGSLWQADKLQIIYFDQSKEYLPMDKSIGYYLGDGDSQVIFRDQAIHLNSYAIRFGFPVEMLGQAIKDLSGGERARALIAKLFLKPADVIILDEPTNDLDIQTIQIMEQAIQSFPGLVLLVSHDRYFLNQTCDYFIGLDGQGGWEILADPSQWTVSKKTTISENKKTKSETLNESVKTNKPSVKLTYLEKKKLETIENEVLEAEEALGQAQLKLELPEIATSHQKLTDCYKEVEEKQKKVDDLYQLWNDLEEKKKQTE